MLSLFKSRYFLKDLIPANYIDIHNHVLPGIDDGAKTIEDTEILISGMKSINISGIIATPHTFVKHFSNTPHTIKDAYDAALIVASDQSFLRGYASEYMLDLSLMKRIKNEKLLCVHDDFILVELPFLKYPLDLYEMLFELKCKDYKIIIAHPERYIYFHRDIKKLEKLKTSGVYFQLNLLSLTGLYGKEIQKIAENLIDRDLYDFTGTDIHNEHHINLFSLKSIYFNKNKIGDLLEKNVLFDTFNHRI